MCVCNGQAYLNDQLSSILAQTRLPDEVVILDDLSADNSWEIIESFSALAPFPVRLLRNSVQLGPAANFAKAISICTSDIIALADQDDVWHADKLERLWDRLSGSHVQAVFSDANVVGSNLEKLGYTMWHCVRFDACEQRRMENGQAFEVLLKHCVVTGATLAFNARLRNTVLPIPPHWPHDAWLALIAAAQNHLLPINEPLIEYRQHEANVIGGKRKNLWHEISSALFVDRAVWYQEELWRWRALAERLESIPTAYLARQALSEKISHLENRANLPAARWRRLPGVWREFAAGHYARHARNWGSIALDLLVK